MTLQLTEATADQIVALNACQTVGWFHPFTCPNRGDGDHRLFNGDHGALVATRRGWICPWCDYTQAWAHDFMAVPMAPNPAPVVADHRIVVAAFRYALGRMTYIVNHVAAWLAVNKAGMTEQDRALIVREIDEAAARDGLESACEAAAWTAVREAMLDGPAAVGEPLATGTRS